VHAWLDPGTFYIAVVEGGQIARRIGGTATHYEYPGQDRTEGGGDQAWGARFYTPVEGGTFTITEAGLHHIVYFTGDDSEGFAPLVMVVRAEMGLRGALNGWGFTSFGTPTRVANGLDWSVEVGVRNIGQFKISYNGGWKLPMLFDGGDPVWDVIMINTNFGATSGSDGDQTPPINAMLQGGPNWGLEGESGTYRFTLQWRGNVMGHGFTGLTATRTGDYDGEILFPDNLFVVGDGTRAGWSPADGITMYQVNGNDHLFYGVVWLEATGSFKFAIQRDWGGDFGQSGGNNDPIADFAEFGMGGGDIPVPGTAGYFVIVVDMQEERISVVEPRLYGMGPAFGPYPGNAWEEGAHPFTVNNANETISSPAAIAAGNLRAFVAHDWIDGWWRAEFNVVGTEIVWRSQGGDPAAFPLTAGQRVVFNFNEGTASVQ